MRHHSSRLVPTTLQQPGFQDHHRQYVYHGCQERLPAYTITEGLNIQTKQSYSWNISLSDEELRKNESFVLRVIPFETDCNREGQEVTSPPFYIKAAPISSVPTTSSYVTTTSSQPSSDSSSSTSETLPSEIPVAAESSPSGGMSIGVKAGVAAGVGFAALLVVAALLLFIKTKRSREHAQNRFGQRAIPEKEVTSDHLGPYQDGPHQDSGRKPVYETMIQADNHGGAPFAPQSHELDGRDLVLELDGERRH